MSIDNTTQKVSDELHPSVRPQDDLFRYVNGTWIDATEIPADQASTGSFIDLRNQAEEDVRTIITELASAGSSDPNAAKIGDLYNSFMNESVINGLGQFLSRPNLKSLTTRKTNKALK